LGGWARTPAPAVGREKDKPQTWLNLGKKKKKASQKGFVKKFRGDGKRRGRETEKKLNKGKKKNA